MAGNKFYAVAVGRATGIYMSWGECEVQVKGFKGARFKSFKTIEQAKDFLQQQQHEQQGAHESMNDAIADVKGRKRIYAKEDTSVAATVVSKKSDSTNRHAHKKKKRLTCNARILERKLLILIQFDGGSRGNPGIAGAGAVVTVQQQQKLQQHQQQNPATASQIKNFSSLTNAFLTLDDLLQRRAVHIRDYVGLDATNNMAEYRGCIAGLQMALCQVHLFCRSAMSELEIKQTKYLDNHGGGKVDNRSQSNDNDDVEIQVDIDLTVQGDSELILQQLQGNYQCKNPKLIPLWRQAKDLIDEFQERFESVQVHMEHVVRSLNHQADALCNAAMDARRSWYTTSDDHHTIQHPWPLPT